MVEKQIKSLMILGVFLLIACSMIVITAPERDYDFGSFSIQKKQLNDINSNFEGPFRLCSIKENKCVLISEVEE